MNWRLLTIPVAVLLLTSTPALAKKKPALSDGGAAAETTELSLAVDTDLSHDPDNILLLDLSNGGRIAIRLMPEWAPHHVERIKELTRQGFYNGVVFHRVIDKFMAQTGDPTGTGAGGSPLPDLEAEFTKVPHMRGMVSMARTNDPNSANSQFFIVFYPQFSLDNKYTVFGRVIAGMDVADRIERGEPPVHPTRVVQASLASENKPVPTAEMMMGGAGTDTVSDDSMPATVTLHDLEASSAN